MHCEISFMKLNALLYSMLSLQSNYEYCTLNLISVTCLRATSSSERSVSTSPLSRDTSKLCFYIHAENSNAWYNCSVVAHWVKCTVVTLRLVCHSEAAPFTDITSLSQVHLILAIP